MTLNESQRIALAVIPKVSSVFSMFGSFWIIIEVATERKKRRVPYHRLMLAMSVYDVLESLSSFFSTWPIPEGTPGVIWAAGNDATCTIQGFTLQFTLAVPLYNAMLSLYYVLVINYNYSDAKLRSFVEPAMHIFCFSWSFGTGVYAATTKLMNNANLWCWIAPLPSDCKASWTFGTVEEGNDNPCIRGDNVWVYRFGFYFIPLWMSIFLATFSTYMVYRYVYARDKATLKYRFPDRAMVFGAMKSWKDDLKLKFAALSSCMGFRARSSSTTTNVDVSGPTIELNDHDGVNAQGEKKNSNNSKRTSSEEFSASEDLVDVYDDDDDDDDDDDGHDLVDDGLLSVVEEVPDEFERSGRSEFEKSGRSDHRSAMKNTRTLIEDDNDTQDPYYLKESNSLKEDVLCPSGAWAVCMNNNKSVEGSVVDSVDETEARLNEEIQQESKRRNTLKRKLSKHVSIRVPQRVSQRVSQWKEKRERFAREMPHTVEVFHQACFYLGAFYCTHLWSTSNRVLQAISGGGSVFPILVCHAFFDPFQGFLNYLVYQRPRYKQLRKRHPEFSRVTILFLILRFSFLGGNDVRTLRSSLRSSARESSEKENNNSMALQSNRSKMGLSSEFVLGEAEEEPNTNESPASET